MLRAISRVKAPEETLHITDNLIEILQRKGSIKRISAHYTRKPTAPTD
jgi:hypothetical protein